MLCVSKLMISLKLSKVLLSLSISSFMRSLSLANDSSISRFKTDHLSTSDTPQYGQAGANGQLRDWYRMWTTMPCRGW